MKKALLISWPSVDSKTGLSEWDQKVTNELLSAAGFIPDKTLFAYPHHVKHWATLFEGRKIGGTPTEQVAKYRQALFQELEGFDIALTLGPHAMWSLTNETKIDTYRGTHIDSPFVEGLQVVPTYEPEIFSRRAWNERPVVVSAARKACSRYEDSPRRIFLPESVADLYAFSTEHIKEQMAFDVETNRNCRITEFSIAPNPSVCLYVQLEDRGFNSIWSQQDELDIFLWLHFLACRRDLTWVMHNATYDLTYLNEYGIRPAGHIADTMLRHHAWQPELEKSLGFLASLHLPTRAWKHLRTKAKQDYHKTGAL
jgi:hypothetical protein